MFSAKSWNFLGTYFPGSIQLHDAKIFWEQLNLKLLTSIKSVTPSKFPPSSIKKGHSLLFSRYDTIFM